MDPAAAQDAQHRFRGTTTLVVGGSVGIGLASAQRLAAERGRVLVADLDLEGAERAVRDLPGEGHLALGIDVLDADAVDTAVSALSEQGITLDALVHVAGGDTDHGDFAETEDETWRAMLELNLLGPVRMLRRVLPALTTSTRTPSAVIVSSVNGALTLGSEPYSSAKAGLVPLIRNLAHEYGPRGVRINAVAPGTVRTRAWEAQGGPDHLAGEYPLRRVGEPSDIAAAIAFLCSPDASWITGHVLPVDGGLSIRRAF
ncbi:SDR family NAD(P)-dependent oxidoreductase [Brachybacterium saurashtrense]|uniref:SDR family NAD(P)-dependent oxidoreductase n=1 Tax=Brachybacterium saurashtrense TaxID=556288 RepID=A0A345YRG1_9MICO|nr:SDR family oxidoreductase [Brachybacterium saurashtrense]AXK46513.1 SDR family NAD(P)-dependent oxidoreductase [Brachybacterium saurashtrense]RRR24254.1 SDR family NAD(P)-dependent oxidoreductase [Brachybacterium saurashtrense]